MVCVGSYLNQNPNPMVCNSKNFKITIVLIYMGTHMNLKQSYMVCNSRNIFELESILECFEAILQDLS
jgi:hypothetical protein